MRKSIDLNCDLGETPAPYQPGSDDEILASISSINLACGFHAGGPAVMRGTARAAIARGVAIGAHPGLPDLAGFGRRPMKISPEEAYEIVLYQVGALQAIVHAEGSTLHHVKPHGALYHMAGADRPLAEAIADALRAFDSNLVLVGFPGGELIQAGKRAGLRTAAEGFADRRYRADGSLVPRTEPDALITDETEAAEQALHLVRDGAVDTICVHGDGAHAQKFARAIRQRLEREGFEVKHFERSSEIGVRSSGLK